ncbi:MAG: hypothetical protein ACJAUA_001173, partial [Zhongshania aliphaticivorans]
MHHKKTKTLFVLIFTLILLGGCSQKEQVVNLGELYNQSAQSHPIDRNPVILIPGIKGSRLIDSETNMLVWGAFGQKDLNPNLPDFAKTFSIPMQEGVPLNELKDTIVADGVLDSVEINLGGISFDLKAYYNIISILGAGQYLDYDIATKGESVDYGEGHYTCFQFAYDWRLSLDENASRLNDFIERQRVFVQQQIEEKYGVKGYDVKFDIIAHSMGGLLSRYFLRYGKTPVESIDTEAPVPWSGTDLVE